jgi:hypothetical protein
MNTYIILGFYPYMIASALAVQQYKEEEESKSKAL